MRSASKVPMTCWTLVRHQMRKKGSERQQRFGAFYVSAHAVTGRLACLSVVPAAVIFNVTPLPE